MTPAQLAASLAYAAQVVAAPPLLMGNVLDIVVEASIPLTPVDTSTLRASEVGVEYAPDHGAVQALAPYAEIVYEGTGTNTAYGPRPYFLWGWEAAQPKLATALQGFGDRLWRAVAAGTA